VHYYFSARKIIGNKKEPKTIKVFQKSVWKAFYRLYAAIFTTSVKQRHHVGTPSLMIHHVHSKKRPASHTIRVRLFEVLLPFQLKDQTRFICPP